MEKCASESPGVVMVVTTLDSFVALLVSCRREVGELGTRLGALSLSLMGRFESSFPMELEGRVSVGFYPTRRLDSTKQLDPTRGRRLLDMYAEQERPRCPKQFGEGGR